MEHLMQNTNIQDRAVGAFIGDAMGLGPHWYYDRAELRRDYENWITNRTCPGAGPAATRTPLKQ
jgi:hypothetical protein